jgi:hypothetical protein
VIPILQFLKQTKSGADYRIVGQKIVKETVSLAEVPKEALYVGMAGVLPYLATSLSTVYLAWDIEHAAHTGAGFLLSGETAEQLLHLIEPIQLGYGAMVGCGIEDVAHHSLTQT